MLPSTNHRCIISAYLSSCCTILVQCGGGLRQFIFFNTLPATEATVKQFAVDNNIIKYLMDRQCSGRFKLKLDCTFLFSKAITVNVRRVWLASATATATTTTKLHACWAGFRATQLQVTLHNFFFQIPWFNIMVWKHTKRINLPHHHRQRPNITCTREYLITISFWSHITQIFSTRLKKKRSILVNCLIYYSCL